MTDDNLPEEQAIHEQPPVQEDAAAPPIPSNRTRRESPPEEKDKVDRLRETFSSKPLIGIIIGSIVLLSLILGNFSVEAGPEDIIADWTELNREVTKLRDSVNQNLFDPSFYSSTAESMENPDAKAWMNIEIASALMATAIAPEDTNQLPPQFRQTQPRANLLAGDATAIQNRLDNLQLAGTYLDKALNFFREADKGDHPLRSLGHYRASYSAAYVTEAKLLLEGADDYDTNRANVIKYLEEASGALPTTQTMDADSTDRDIQSLRLQITKRLELFEQMSESQFDASDELQTGVPSNAIYSWISSYIAAKNAVQPDSPSQPDSPDSSNDEEAAPTGTNPSDNGDFQLDDADASEPTTSPTDIKGDAGQSKDEISSED